MQQNTESELVEYGRASMKSEVGVSVVALSEQSEMGGAEHALESLLALGVDREQYLVVPVQGALVDRARSMGVEVRVSPDMESGGIGVGGGRDAVIMANRLALAGTAVAIGRATNSSVAVYVHDPPDAEDPRCPLLREWDRTRAISLFICTTEYVRDRLGRVIPIEGRCTVAPPVQSSCGCEPGRERDGLVAIGRLHPSKNLGLLLGAVSLLVNNGLEVDVKIVGDSLFGQFPDHPDALVRRARELGLKDEVEFCGFVTDASKHSFLRDAAGLVHCAKAETFGLAMAEAMAHELPVVAVESPGSQILVDPGITGFRVEAEEKNVAAAIDALLSRPEQERRRMGLAGRRKWETLSSESVGIWGVIDEFCGS